MLAASIRTQLLEAGIVATPLLPESEADAISTVRGLCNCGDRPLIIAAGGDGTVNTVINGMERESATLGVIPLGTANVLARELGITSLSEAVARIATGTPRPFSVGHVQSSATTRLFLLMAGVGIDGAIVAGVRPDEKRRLGKLAYLLSGLRRMVDWDRTQLTVSDGERSATCHSVVIANAAHYGGPYILAPGADIFSPALDVVTLQTFTRSSFIRFALTLIITGKAPMSPERWQLRTGRLMVTGAKAVQVDGDDLGTGPLSISLIPRFNDIMI
jgi:diacylglycerol kinase family enzyme